jgi:hypothetical protein
LQKIKRKIRRRKKGTKSRPYFTKETQTSIEKYQNTDIIEEKQTIYEKEIRTAFEKLVENLIHVYNFNAAYDTFDTLKSDCVSFLYESLHKWSPERGTKAFSYFNVCGKNWLIIKTRQQKKRVSRHISTSNMNDFSPIQKQSYASYDLVPGPDEIMIEQEKRGEIFKLLTALESQTHNPTEKLCLSAVRKVFEAVDTLDFLNKRAVLIYVREFSGLDPKRLSVAMSALRKQYKKLTKDKERFDFF